MALKDLILSADDLGHELVFVPEWNVKIEMRGLSGKQRADMKHKITDDKGLIDDSRLYREIAINCIYDPETGQKVFDEKDGESIIVKSGNVLERLSRIALTLSGMIEGSLKDTETNF